MVAKRSLQSVTFPALGTGMLKYPVKDVAKNMIEAMMEYVEENRGTSVREVRLVIYHKDDKTYKVRIENSIY